jgi:uncharacterized protein HemX
LPIAEPPAGQRLGATYPMNKLVIALLIFATAAGVTGVCLMKTQQDDLHALKAQVEEQHNAVQDWRLSAEGEAEERRANEPGPRYRPRGAGHETVGGAIRNLRDHR